MATLDVEKIREGLSYRPRGEVRNEARQTLDRLLRWSGKVIEFLDSFEGSFVEDELAIEALSLQEEGLNLGLQRVYNPPEKEGQ